MLSGCRQQGVPWGHTWVPDVRVLLHGGPALQQAPQLHTQEQCPGVSNASPASLAD
jgi:hypothetical protein